MIRQADLHLFGLVLVFQDFLDFLGKIFEINQILNRCNSTTRLENIGQPPNDLWWLDGRRLPPAQPLFCLG